jgi:hypothetical protein
MKKNMGLTDRIIRFGLAISIIALYASNIITGTLALLMLLLVGVFFITSMIGFCPLYLPFGISTMKKSDH